MLAVIAAAVDLAVGVGEEQPSAERRARGQREIVEPGAEAVMARPDPMREEIAAVDRRAMGAIAVEEGRPTRAARIAEILPDRKRPARLSQQRRPVDADLIVQPLHRGPGR